MRPYRAHLSLRPSPNTPKPPVTLPQPCTPIRHSGAQQVRLRSAPAIVPPDSRFKDKPSRFTKYEDLSTPIEPSTHRNLPRNPLNYVELERRRLHHNQYWRRRMMRGGFGLACCVVAQAALILTFGEDVPRPSDAVKGDASGRVEKMDAQPGAPGGDGNPIVVGKKPGMPEVKLDAEGNELVETGTSSVPHFPRTIRLPASSVAPASSSIVPSASPQEKTEEYTLLGHGIRTVSFLYVQVYVLGIYVRTADLPLLQAAFVRQISPNATSLIPGEKAELRKQLLDPRDSRRIWDGVLREAGVRSAIRVVPTRGTGFSHLRDGWIKGIQKGTKEAREAAAKDQNEAALSPQQYDDESFGNSVAEFKTLFSGKGNAPKGSVLMLARDEKGRLNMSFLNTAPEREKSQREELGGVDDERISRLVWLNYLGGKDVSSEPARASVVNGVMDLVERPLGTVGVGAT